MNAPLRGFSGIVEVDQFEKLALISFDPQQRWDHCSSPTDLTIETIIRDAISLHTDIDFETALTQRTIGSNTRFYMPGKDPDRVIIWSEEHESLLITVEALGIVLTLYAYQQLSHGGQWSLFYERQEKVSMPT